MIEKAWNFAVFDFHFRRQPLVKSLEMAIRAAMRKSSRLHSSPWAYSPGL
jgi:hypothetical protein